MTSNTLSHWFRFTSVGESARPMIYLHDHAIDYPVLAQQVDRLVQQLRAHSVGEGQRLALFSSSSSILQLMTHAAAMLGATFYPLDPALPPAWHQAVLKNAAVDFLIACEGVSANDVADGSFSVSALKYGGLVSVNRTEVAVMLATSGSSGEPKTVLLSSQSIYNSAVAVNRRVRLEAADCWLNCLPLFHIGGLSIVFRTVLAGASMVLHQGFDAVRVWHDISLYRVSHLSLVPVMLAKLLAVSEGPPPGHLRVVLVGGAALDDNLARRALAAGWPLFVTYGMSETGSQVATGALTVTTMGDPIPLLDGVDCAVVDEAGEPTQGIGRIRLRGNLLMQGYANPQQRVGEGLDGDGWYTTGDRGCYQPGRGVQVLGRADDLIISGGENIHPHSLERLLSDCPGVDEVCVIGVADAEWGERVCAIYTGDLHEQALAQWCQQNLGAQRPRLFVHVQHLPRLSAGKIDRAALKQQYTVV